MVARQTNILRIANNILACNLSCKSRVPPDVRSPDNKVIRLSVTWFFLATKVIRFKVQVVGDSIAFVG